MCLQGFDSVSDKHITPFRFTLPLVMVRSLEEYEEISCCSEHVSFLGLESSDRSNLIMVHSKSLLNLTLQSLLEACE